MTMVTTRDRATAERAANDPTGQTGSAYGGGYRPTCAGCGEYWPCSDSRRHDLRGDVRALHVVNRQQEADHA